MICLITRNHNLVKEVTRLLKSVEVSVRVLDPASELAIPGLYASGITAAVVDESIPGIPSHAWFDMLGSLGRRMPIFVLGRQHRPEHEHAYASRNSELIAWLDEPDADELVGMLDACGATGKAGRITTLHRIPVYNGQVPLHMLKGSGAMSMLTINAGSFRKIAIEYGVEAYQKLQDCFHSLLYSMWGQPGCFRRTDMLMRRSLHSNTYYVFLEQSRVSRTVPAPGVLEKMADRLAVRLQQSIWNEIFKDRATRMLPDCINLVPEICVGHATALYNPCVDPFEVLEQVLESSVEVSKVQARRIKDRERELMQTLIQARDLLYPHYQAVFHLPELRKDMIDQCHAEKSIAPIRSLVYGFESLIRARHEIVNEKLAGDHLVHLEARFLRPDIMFAWAGHAKVALELDQVCLQLGVAYAVDLPGRLMVNILPRNLLHIERLTHLLTPRDKIVFELSESEAVTNPQLMERVRDYVSKLGFSIAADDFGKGHGSIERVIKLRPELIKLDRSLIEKIHSDPAKRSFVDGVVKAAKLVNATVLAEGVESWEEAEVVQAMGVDLIQGYLVHRPQPIELILPQIKEEDDGMVLLDSVA